MNGSISPRWMAIKQQLQKKPGDEKERKSETRRFTPKHNSSGSSSFGLKNIQNSQCSSSLLSEKQKQNLPCQRNQYFPVFSSEKTFKSDLNSAKNICVIFEPKTTTLKKIPVEKGKLNFRRQVEVKINTEPAIVSDKKSNEYIHVNSQNTKEFKQQLTKKDKNKSRLLSFQSMSTCEKRYNLQNDYCEDGFQIPLNDYCQNGLKIPKDSPILLKDPNISCEEKDDNDCLARKDSKKAPLEKVSILRKFTQPALKK